MLKFFCVIAYTIFFNTSFVCAEITDSHDLDSHKNESEKAKRLNDKISVQAVISTGDFLTDNNKKYLISEISDDAKNEVISWVRLQFVFVSVLSLLGFAGGFMAIIQYCVKSAVDAQMLRVETARDEAIESTIKAKFEIARTEEALKELQKLEAEVNSSISNNSLLLKTQQTEIKEFKETIGSDYKDLIEDSKSNKEDFYTGFEAHTLWLKTIDKSEEAANLVVENLIEDLKGGDETLRIKAVELLTNFTHIKEKEKIISELRKVLEYKHHTPLVSIILSKIDEFDMFSTDLNSLILLCDDLTNPNVATIIGALGNLQEKRKNDSDSIGKIVNKLESLLDSLIHNRENIPISNEEIDTIKNAIALALSNSGELGEKAVPLLIHLIEDISDNEYRRSAAIALGNIGEKAIDSIPALKKLQKDPSLVVNLAAQEAIDKIEKNI